jgi:hypothetical protein
MSTFVQTLEGAWPVKHRAAHLALIGGGLFFGLLNVERGFAHHIQTPKSRAREARSNDLKNLENSGV